MPGTTFVSTVHQRFAHALNSPSVSMYADDTSLCYRSKYLTILNGALDEDLKRLDFWLRGNKLSVVTPNLD